MNSKEKDIVLSKRLSSAASFVREGAILADIGTDHGYLPIYCVKNGICERAIAADINSMPLDRAVENIKYYGLSDRIECVLTSGFDDLDKKGITDGAVCGMGGELIAEIIKAADHLKRRGVRLIIQPMTMHDVARKALYDSGFEITAEKMLFEEGKYYTVICAEYKGELPVPDKHDILLGEREKIEYIDETGKNKVIDHLIGKYERIRNGRSKASMDVSDITLVIEELWRRRNL